MKPGDHVNRLGDNSGHDKGVGSACDEVGNLDVELLVVVVEEPSSNDARVDAVKSDDVVCRKETVEYKTDHAANGVFSEHIEGVVDFEQELDLCTKVTADTSNNA